MWKKRLKLTAGGSLALAIGMLSGGSPQALAAPTQAPIIGEVQFMTVQDPNDTWSRGIIVVGGQNIIVPRNLLIDLPANRLTLQQIFAEAPPTCLAAGESGLAKADTCNSSVRRTGAIATILANRTNAGDVIAGEIMLAKGTDAVTGVVTFINHTDGYLRVNGIPGSATTGAMIRINDPIGRFTIQQGLGCAGGPNCSADPRYGVDSDNYTVSFSTGYPACIPSTVTGGARTTGSDSNGQNDSFCPHTNRQIAPVSNSFRFSPIQLGDSLTVEGNFEIVNGVQFLSAHTLSVHASLATAPGQPDYMTFAEVEWDTAGFQNERVRALFIGFTTLPDSQLDLFALHTDTSNEAHEVLLGSTVGNPDTVNQGIGVGAGGIFKVRYDVDFLAGVEPRGSPCVNLANAGFSPSQSGCPGGASLDITQNFRKLVPISREMIGRTRNKVNNNIGDSRDIQGNPAPNGEYLTPVGIGHPEFVEIDLARIQTPFIFAGQPWNLDRRLGPGGCDETLGCGSTRQPLDPFPFSGLNPSTQAQFLPATVPNRILTFFPFGPNNVLPWPPIDPPSQGISPTPIFPPATAPDLARTRAGLAVEMDLLRNDREAGLRAFEAHTLTIVRQPKHGKVEIHPGTGKAVYTPDSDFVGFDHFHYTIENQGITSNATLVKVQVRK